MSLYDPKILQLCHYLSPRSKDLSIRRVVPCPVVAETGSPVPKEAIRETVDGARRIVCDSHKRARFEKFRLIGRDQTETLGAPTEKVRQTAPRLGGSCVVLCATIRARSHFDCFVPLGVGC